MMEILLNFKEILLKFKVCSTDFKKYPWNDQKDIQRSNIFCKPPIIMSLWTEDPEWMLQFHSHWKLCIRLVSGVDQGTLMQIDPHTKISLSPDGVIFEAPSLPFRLFPNQNSMNSHPSVVGIG